MNKFQKRIKKTVGKTNNCIVIGGGFGNLSTILTIFHNVFVLSDNKTDLRAKNLIYKESCDDFSNLMDINGIFLDLDHITYLSKLVPSTLRYNCPIMIEGNEPIGRDLSKSLYDHHYSCTDQQGEFHVWRIV